MDELPERLVEAVGDATAIELIDIGGGDIVAITPAETYCYRSEGLLSDETVDRYPHDIDRLTTEAGRRKTTIHFETIDGERSLTVPGNVADEVIEAILKGVLRTADVVDDGETIQALFRFSELTLVVTEDQLLKHVGSAVWNDDYEAFAYEALTDLDFEEGSVATQVIVEVDGRRQRVKVPNEHAGRVRQEVQSAVFEYHDVSSLGGLRAEVREEEDEEESEADEDDTDSESSAVVDSDWSPPADQDVTSLSENKASSGGTDESITGSDAERNTDDAAGATAADVDALAEQVDELTETVERQSELIEAQQETLEKLVDELRRGR
ncbi:hypothetical protein HWV23_03270 [Natronomonas halophila]|uniref:DUF7115 domain-containing protein n=1 Tax=Natronomonas halophila TaxID=2747817 RepID=UPI0015B3E07E|nr:hypothetical protein [Natronomonas halophila]QLD84773.1 hypothetical protein HWV23_03270 [Natronomonas halophila]